MDMNEKQKTLLEISNINKNLFIMNNSKNAYFSLILTQLQKIISTSDSKESIVSSAAIRYKNLKYALIVNLDFWKKLENNNKKIGLLIHELFHVIYDHPTRALEYDNMELYNIACDLNVNTLIEDAFGKQYLPGVTDKEEWENVHLPKINKAISDFNNDLISTEEYNLFISTCGFRPILAEDYKDYLTRNDCKKSVKYIYKKLLAQVNEQEKSQSSSNTTFNNNFDSDSNIENIKDEQNEQDEQDEQDDKLNEDSPQKLKPNANSLSDLISNVTKESNQNNNHPLNNHDWKELNEQTDSLTMDAVKDNLVKQIQDAFNNSASIGTLPSELQEYINDVIKNSKPITDWKAEFRNWIGGYSNKYKVKRTRIKPNLIIPDGFRLKIYNEKHILLLLDTSGSMSIENDIKPVLQEAKNIMRFTSYGFTLVFADTKVQKVLPLENHKDIDNYLSASGIMGRGGTNIEFLKDYLKESKNKYTGIVYLTDGELNPPSYKIPLPFLLLFSKKNEYYKNRWKEYKILTLKN